MLSSSSCTFSDGNPQNTNSEVKFDVIGGLQLAKWHAELPVCSFDFCKQGCVLDSQNLVVIYSTIGLCLALNLHQLSTDTASAPLGQQKQILGHRKVRSQVSQAGNSVAQ